MISAVRPKTKGKDKRNTTASPEQVEAWRKCKPGDEVRVRLRTSNVQRFIVCEWPEEFARADSRPGQVHGRRRGDTHLPIRRIAAFELVLE